VIIGEGQQFFNRSNVELFRGSSSVQDDQSVNENISNQVTGLARCFQTSFYPVTDGSGRGVITNDPTKVQVTAIDPQGNLTPVTVISLNGATGEFCTQLIIPSGYELLITYNFKRGDTFVGIGGVAPYNVPENLLSQVPSTATQIVNGLTGSPPLSGHVVVSLTNPGFAGNFVTLQLVDSSPSSGVPDALAVSGAGTNAIAINIRKSDGSARTLADLVNLINAGIPTLNGGDLTVSAITGDSAAALSATFVVVSVSPVTTALGSAANYAILAYSGITNTGSSVITGGNIGSAPTPGPEAGFTFTAPAAIDNTNAAAARIAGQAAVTYYSGLTPTQSGLANLSANNGGGGVGVYHAGVYSGGALDIPTSITLDAQGNPNAVFVFIAASTTVLESGASVLLTNGAQAANVVWVVGSSFTQIGNNNTMVGTILAYASISLDGGSLNGRALAVGGGNGAVTIAAAEAVNVSAGSNSTTVGTPGAILFAGGHGGNSNTVFKVAHAPITDGTNGGVVTTDVTKVIVQVNGSNVTVASLNGAAGTFTLASPVSAPIALGGTTTSFTIQYYFNTWQNTYDLIPAANVASITQVGLGPNRSDFVQGTDYVLGTVTTPDGTVLQTINWGASVSLSIGQSAAGESANFTPAEVTTALRDDHVYLQPLAGAVNGKNTVFSLPDVPTDGSGLSVATDNPALVQVYVGSDPLEAFLSGAKQVAQLSGANQLVTLYNPPAAGNFVYASYYRSQLADHQYSITVVNPGYAGNGTFIITDELGRVIPLVTFTGGSVAQAGPFADTGVVYPNDFSDAQAQAGAAVDETVTLTFNNDGNSVTVPAIQATLTLNFNAGAGHLTFTASTPGTGGNLVQIVIDATDTNADPIVVNGDIVTIYSSWAGTPLTLAQIAALFPSGETIDGGQVLCVATGTISGQAATTGSTNLAGGTNAVSAPVTHSYTVHSSVSKGSGSINNTGYLDQTYEDLATGFRVTVVNPADHAAYGVPSIPLIYNFTPGDTLTFTVATDAAGSAHQAVRNAGTPGVAPAQANNLIAIQGLDTTVISDFGSTAGDSVIVSTFNKSGNNPNIGEFYYVSFTTAKTAADYAIKLYTDPKVAYAQYGAPSTINRVSLAIQLMAANGVQTFGVIQVPVVPGTNQGTSQDFMNAIQTLTVALPGNTTKANIICPLSTDPTVHQFLSRQLTTQANVRQKGEAIGFVGYDQFQTPSTMRANARGLANKRMIAIGAPVAGILITNPNTGVAVEYAVSGEFMAAAMMGLEANPSNDVAQSLTFQNLVGFSRLLVTYDDPTMDSMAADGLTDLLNNNGALLIRHYKTTDPSNPLTSEPTVTTITDYTSQVFRTDLNQFIGRKLLDSLVSDIQVVCNARLSSLVNQQIISGYQNLSVVQDPTDPTQADVTVTFKPMFCLLYVSVTFIVQTQLS
jgi:hypothetical protein